MCLIQFKKDAGPCDLVSPIVNLIGTGFVLVAVGVTLGAITQVALKALGYSATATKLAMAIPVSLGAIGVLTIGAGAALFAYILWQVCRKPLMR